MSLSSFETLRMALFVELLLFPAKAWSKSLYVERLNGVRLILLIPMSTGLRGP